MDILLLLKSIASNCDKEANSKFNSSEFKHAQEDKLIFLILGAANINLLILLMDILLIFKSISSNCDKEAKSKFNSSEFKI